MHRQGLLLTAVATVTLPGVLALMAVLGHEHVAASGGAAANGSTTQSGRLPVASATARRSVRNDVAGIQPVSGALAVHSRMTARQQAKGMRLLTRAAAAGLATSYQGTELTSQSGLDGSVRMTSQIWHSGGGLTLVQTSSSASPPATSAEEDSGSPEGVFGVTRPLVAQLDKHYVVLYEGHGSAVGRAAMVVELYRFDGSLAARYWLDTRTMVPLRRQLFDTSDKVISEDSFERVQFGTAAARQPASPGTVKALKQLQSPAQAGSAQQPAWVAAPPARFLASLASQGWQVPGSLPGGLPLYAAAWTTTSAGKVVDLEYSDGLYVVSLFVQRGTLAAKLPGWRQVSVSGQQAYVMGHSVTWARPGFVYTVIADAPPQTVTQVISAVPRSASPGLLERLGRGFTRIARLVDPFA